MTHFLPHLPLPPSPPPSLLQWDYFCEALTSASGGRLMTHASAANAMIRTHDGVDGEDQRKKYILIDIS